MFENGSNGRELMAIKTAVMNRNKSENSKPTLSADEVIEKIHILHGWVIKTIRVKSIQSLYINIYKKNKKTWTDIIKSYAVCFFIISIYTVQKINLSIFIPIKFDNRAIINECPLLKRE